MVNLIYLVMVFFIAISGCIYDNVKEPQWEIQIDSDTEWSGVIWGTNLTDFFHRNSILTINGTGNKIIHCPKTTFDNLTVQVETDMCQNIGITLLDNGTVISRGFGLNEVILKSTGPIETRDKKILARFNVVNAPYYNCINSTETSYSTSPPLTCQFSPKDYVIDQLIRPETYDYDLRDLGFSLIDKEYPCINASKLNLDFDITKSPSKFELYSTDQGVRVGHSITVNGFIIRCDLEFMNSTNKTLFKKSFVIETKEGGDLYFLMDEKDPSSEKGADDLAAAEKLAFWITCRQLSGKILNILETEIPKYEQYI